MPVLGDFDSEIFVAYTSFTSKRAGEIAAPNTKIPVKARATNFEVRAILLPILVSMINEYGIQHEQKALRRFIHRGNYRR
jgi:hypothetical protein